MPKRVDTQDRHGESRALETPPARRAILTRERECLAGTDEFPGCATEAKDRALTVESLARKEDRMGIEG